MLQNGILTNTAEYGYDGLGRRISKTVNGNLTKYIYNGQHIIQELDGDNQILKTYTHGPSIDEILFRTDNAGRKLYFHADHQGSTSNITDSSGVSVKSYRYDAYGAARSESGIINDNTFLYTGRQLDAETGLYYYRTRYYDPQKGRFTKKDILYGNVYKPLTLNSYIYCNNNPVRWKDPLGLSETVNVEFSGEIKIIDVGATVLGVGVGAEVSAGFDGSIKVSGNVGPVSGSVTITGGGSGESSFTASKGDGPGKGLGGWM